MTRFELANDGATIRCVRPLHHMRHIGVQYILYLKKIICKVIVLKKIKKMCFRCK